LISLWIEQEDIPKIIKIENTVKKKFLKNIIIFLPVLTYLFGLICIDNSMAYLINIPLLVFQLL